MHPSPSNETGASSIPELVALQQRVAALTAERDKLRAALWELTRMEPPETVPANVRSVVYGRAARDFALQALASSEAEPLGPVGGELKPMASAPKPREGENLRLLVLDEWFEMGERVRDWKLVYWLDAWDSMPAGWYGKNCGDLRHPVGWVLCTAQLPASA